MNRHPTDIFSLVFGLVLAGIGGVLSVTDISPRLFDGDYLWPASLGLFGLLLLAIGMARTGTGSREVSVTGPQEDHRTGSTDEDPPA